MPRKKFIRQYWELVNRIELMALGGQVTYYMILSFFPLLILLLTLIGYANLSSEQFFNDLKYLLPEETYLLVESIVYEIFAKRSPTLLSVGMVGTVWAALNGINALMRGIVKAYGLTEERSFWKLKLTAILFLIMIMTAILVSVPILFWGESLGSTLFQSLGATIIFPYLWQKLRLLIEFLILIATFIILNAMATHARYSFRSVLPGSLFAATGWVVISLAFSFYVKNFNNFSVTYGSIGGIMVLLLWLYWSAEILLLGSALNAVLIKTKEKKRQ